MKKIIIVLFLSLFFLTGCNDELNCPNGYELDGDVCKKEVDHADPLEQVSCDVGFELVDDSCYKKEEAEVLTKYGCEDGLTLDNGKCVGTLTKDTKTIYTCETGTVSGDKCVTSTEVPTALTKTPTCPQDYSLLDGSCWWGARPPISDNCDVYEHIYTGCTCDAPDTLGPDFFCYQKHTSVTYNYECAEGTVLKSKKCYQETTTNATATQGCDTGYTLENNKCVKNVNQRATNIKYCEDGFELVENKCVKEETKAPNKEYTCPDDYEYKDNLCRKYAQIEIK